MMTMHDPHGIDPTNGADALRSLQGLAQGVKELAGMLPPPKAADGSPGDNRTRMWTILKELRPDGLTLEPNRCDGCWICNEITRLGGKRLLNEDGEDMPLPLVRRRQGRATRDVPVRIFSMKKYVECGRVEMLIAVGAHLKARRAWTRDNSNGHSANNILQRMRPSSWARDLTTLRTKEPTCATSAKRCSTDRSRASSRRRQDTCHTKNSPLDGSTGRWTRAGSVSTAGQTSWTSLQLAAPVRGLVSPRRRGQRR